MAMLVEFILRASRQLQLFEYKVHVMLDGGHTQAEFSPDLFIRKPAANQLKHFALRSTQLPVGE